MNSKRQRPLKSGLWRKFHQFTYEDMQGQCRSLSVGLRSMGLLSMRLLGGIADRNLWILRARSLKEKSLCA